MCHANVHIQRLLIAFVQFGKTASMHITYGRLSRYWHFSDYLYIEGPLWELESDQNFDNLSSLYIPAGLHDICCPEAMSNNPSAEN